MYRECRHVKPNGLRCGSPALRGALYCYFHAKLHSVRLDLPVPENRAAIRKSVARVLEALRSSRIGANSAHLILYGLQIAAQNVEKSGARPAPKPPAQS